MEETLWQKWSRHYKNGGFLYAIYRGIKYLIWGIKTGGSDKRRRT